MITTTVKVFDRFPEITEAVDRLAREVVDAGSQEAASVAAAIGAANGATDIHVIPAHGSEDGYTGGVSGRWYYRFLSYGTLGNAIRSKRPGHIRSHAPGTGITPNYMWQRARTAGRRAMLARLSRGL